MSASPNTCGPLVTTTNPSQRAPVPTFHLIKSLVEYKAPIRFDAEIETAVRTARLGRTSLTFELAIFGKGEEESRASGEIVYVNANRATRKAAPIPSALEALIRAREYANGC